MRFHDEMRRTLSSSGECVIRRIGKRTAILISLVAAAPVSAQLTQLSWQLRAIEGPDVTSGHAMAFDVVRGVTILFGGYSAQRFDPVSTTREWNSLTWRVRASSIPSARVGHDMVFDSARGEIVMFGGAAGSGTLNADTWAWSGDNWLQRSTSGPSARSGHGLAYDSARRVVVLFGGSAGPSGVLGDTWEWDGAAWTRRTVPGPSARWGHTMAYDAARNVTVLFGGIRSGLRNAETWEWNGQAWTQRQAAGPRARNYAAMAYDEARRVTVLHGGAGGSSIILGDCWEWDGLAWTERNITGPTPRWGHEMVYDTVRRTMVLCGEANASYIRLETWELCSSSVSVQPGSVRACVGQRALFSVTNQGSLTVGRQWQWQPGGPGSDWVDLVEGLNTHPGTGTPALDASDVQGSTLGILRLDGALSGPALAVRCIVTNPCESLASEAAMVSVCGADVNCDAIVDLYDFSEFVRCFELGDCVGTRTADFNADGFVDFFDYGEFVAAFEAGCVG
jgi:hypothetical protein